MYELSLLISLYITCLLIARGEVLGFLCLPLFSSPILNEFIGLVQTTGFLFFFIQVFLGLLPLIYFNNMREEEISNKGYIQIISVVSIVLLNLTYTILSLFFVWNDTLYTFIATILWLIMVIGVTGQRLKHGNNKYNNFGVDSLTTIPLGIKDSHNITTENKEEIWHRK